MHKLKSIYLLIITMLWGAIILGAPSPAQATSHDICSSTTIGRVCNSSLSNMYVCKDISGTPTCVCRWGKFEIVKISTNPTGDICKYIEGITGGVNNPRGGMIVILNLVIAGTTALVIMAATVSLAIGGYIYMTAGGSADKVGTAKKWIMSAILGIIIALYAWIILAAINPNLS